MSFSTTKARPKSDPLSEILSPAVLKLIISENVESQITKNRLTKKITQLGREGKLSRLFLDLNSTKTQLEWAYRIFSASHILGDYSWWGWETRSEWAWELANKKWFYPQWNGKPCKLLVLAEQGLGDEILFSTCFGDLQKQNPDLTIECDSRLIPVFTRSFPGIRFVDRWDGKIGVPKELHMHRGEFDAFIPAGNVPKLYRTSRTSFPRLAPLRADPERVNKWREFIPRNSVGIVHIAGGFDEKAVSFEDLIQGTPINLHHRIRVDGVRNEYPDDFEDFLGLLGAVRHVNCVPSAAAHLCGALGYRVNVIKPPMVIGVANTILKYAYPRETGKMLWYGDPVNFYSSLRDFHYRMRRLPAFV